MKLKSLLIKWNNYCCFNRKKTITTIKPVKTKRQHLFVYQQDTASYFTSKELGLKPQQSLNISVERSYFTSKELGLKPQLLWIRPIQREDFTSKELGLKPQLSGGAFDDLFDFTSKELGLKPQLP